jgi:predicted O-methyltransferase YrrM
MTLTSTLLFPWRFFRNAVTSWFNPKLTDDRHIKKLMDFFQADVYGHQANIATADLGFGFIHYGLLRQLKPKSVLCIGSRYGFIPAVLASACKDNGFGHVYFVDAGFDESDEKAYTGQGFWRRPEGQTVFARFGLDSFITTFVTTTKAFAAKYPDVVFDYIYVDGDHSYRGAAFDYATFWPKLLPNGLMVWHDSSIKETLQDGSYGVWKVIEKAKKTAHCLTFPALTAGLAILQKTVNRKTGRKHANT